ncbi:MAG TPA: pirin family protein [Acidimicrobiales bacterium]|jgi:redox-sensitive bicupin YhaK (pirin superfamily)|nr:pirin family protein [Acidimicrobiales bacterium]
MTQRDLSKVVTAHRQLEGAGFAVYRPFPSASLEMLDPFLMLDEKEPTDYPPGEAKGAPDHPHRGFETVSYVLEGETEHMDSLGNHGLIRQGEVQWMTAGDGIIHSEMPSQKIRTEGGRVHGFQLWVNLPANQKRATPRYQAITADQIPVVEGDRWKAIVIAGELFGVRGPANTHTPICYSHIAVEATASLDLALPVDHQIGLYVFRGSGLLGANQTPIEEHEMAMFEPSHGTVRVSGSSDHSLTEILLMAGKPIGEPVARYGPFVMNSQSEILEAIEDFEAGRMGKIAATGTA